MKQLGYILPILFACLLSIPAMAQENELEKGEEFHTGKDLFLAIKNFKEAYEAAPSYLSGKKLAVAYQDNKDYENAEAIYRAIATMDGFLADDHYSLGQLLLYNNKPGEAADHLRKYMAATPEDETVRKLILFCQLLVGGQVDHNCNQSNETALCVTIDARSAVDPGNPNLIFEWVIDNTEPKTGFLIDHCFDHPGVYKARLNVIDITTGMKFNNDTIVMLDIKEQGAFDMTGIKRAGYMIDFDADHELQFGDKDYTFIWGYDDGTFGVGPHALHTYRVSGNYRVRMYLLAFNDKGVSESGCIYEPLEITTNIHDLY